MKTSSMKKDITYLMSFGSSITNSNQFGITNTVKQNVFFANLIRN